MSIQIGSLVGNPKTDYFGAWIKYEDVGRIEIGRIKSIETSNNSVYAVFKCNGEWNRFEDFTAEGCDPEMVTFLNEDLFTPIELPVLREGFPEKHDVNEVELHVDLDDLGIDGKTFFYRRMEDVFETNKLLTEDEYQTMIGFFLEEAGMNGKFSTFQYRWICKHYEFADLHGPKRAKKVLTFEQYELFKLDERKDEIQDYYSKKSKVLEEIYRDLKYINGNDEDLYLFQNPFTKEVYKIKKLENGEMMKAVFVDLYQYKRTANKEKGEKAGSGFLPFKTATEKGFELE